jgi:hypothetical protein
MANPPAKALEVSHSVAIAAREALIDMRRMSDVHR